MANLSNIDWESIKSLCNKVVGIEERAKKLGLSYVFSIELGIYNCRVYSVLYKKGQGSTQDVDLVKFLEYDYFEKMGEFEQHLKEVNELLNGGYDEQKAYETELEALNKRYGK